MKTKFFVYSGRTSDGAKELADAIDGKRIKVERSKYVNKPNHVLINWGSSSIPFSTVSQVLNRPENVAIAVNKLLTFQKLPEHLRPEFTDNQETATSWLEKGKTVCARQKLRASGGDGLLVFGPDNFKDWGQLAVAPLYTMYMKKAAEYRVHVFKDTVIDVQEKRVKSDLPEGFKVNYQIQNLENGFIYAREGLEVPTLVLDNAIESVAALGLDFGAVDVIWNEKNKRALVLEINTAPGLQGSTVGVYAERIKALANV